MTEKSILVIGRGLTKVRFNLNKYKWIYAYKSTLDAFRCCIKDKIEIIPDDFFTAIDYLKANNNASILLETLYSQIVDANELNALFEIGGPEYAEFLTKKVILSEIEKICRFFLFVENLIRYYSIKEEIDFIPNYFSFEVYQKMRKNKFISDKIKIPTEYLLRFKYWETGKNIFNIARLMFYPEFLFLKITKKNNNEKTTYKYKYGVHVSDPRGFNPREGSVDFFVDEKIIKKNEVIFLIDEDGALNYDFKKRFKAEFKRRGYNLLIFHYELLENFSRLRYLKMYYSSAKKLQKKLIKLCSKISVLSSACFHLFSQHLLWSLFYDNYHVEKFIGVQHPGNLTRVFVMRKHGSKSIFLHRGITYDRLNRQNEPRRNKAEQCYYSHLIFDKVYSDKLSNQWLRSSQNKVGEFINIGSIFSDIVYNVKQYHKNEIKKRLGIPEKKPLISFFDGTVGYMGVLNFSEEYCLATSIRQLLKEQQDYFFAFKFKKKKTLEQVPKDHYLAQEFKNLFQNSRCICVNDTDIINYELMGASDLVIATPLSSVIFEAVIGGIKTICYDPLGRYNQRHYIIENFPHFTAHNYEELAKNIDYWLKKASEKDFNGFQCNYITKYTGDYCDGRTLERFKNSLLTA